MPNPKQGYPGRHTNPQIPRDFDNEPGVPPEQSYLHPYDLDFGRVEMGPYYQPDSSQYETEHTRFERHRRGPRNRVIQSIKSFFGIGPRGYKRSETRAKRTL